MRWAAWAQLRIAVNGWLSSCASDVVSCPIVATRLTWPRSCSKLLQLDFRHLAGQQIGKHFSDEVELLLQVVRRRALVTDRAEHQPSHDSPPRLQRQAYLGLDAVREIALPIPRRVIRQLLEPRHRDELSPLETGRDPREVLGRPSNPRSPSNGQPRRPGRTRSGCRDRPPGSRRPLGARAGPPDRARRSRDGRTSSPDGSRVARGAGAQPSARSAR